VNIRTKAYNFGEFNSIVLLIISLKMSYEAYLDMEIRKLRPAELYTLGSILSISDSWKKLMSIVPKQGNVPKFTSDHIR